MSIKNIFAHTNRGVLLDIVVFVLNLFLMRMLTGYFVSLIRRVSASNDDSFAVLQLGLFFTGMLVLPAAGAILKRWHFQRRHAAQQESEVWGCLCNPIFYFAVSLVISATAVSLLGTAVFGRDFQNKGAVFVPLIFGAFFVSLLQTFFVYHYFSPQKKAPKSPFLRDPRSALAGDICIYLNMILFQVLWNTISFIPFERVGSFGEFAGRLFFLCFISLLIYFPPRIFYLAEDARRPVTWLTMLLANSPVILRVLLGVNLGITR